MSEGRKDFEILREKILNFLENEGYKAEEIEMKILHNSKIEGMGHSGGQTVGEIKLTVIKKYGMMNRKDD